MQSIQNYILESIQVVNILEKFNDAKNGDEFYTRLEDIEKGLKPFDFAYMIYWFI